MHVCMCVYMSIRLTGWMNISIDDWIHKQVSRYMNDSLNKCFKFLAKHTDMRRLLNTQLYSHGWNSIKRLRGISDGHLDNVGGYKR